MTKNTYWNEGEAVSERNDHVASATEAIKYIEAGDEMMEYAPNAAAVAQVHATLALVEQQRIANIISLGEHWQSTGNDFADSVAPILRDDIQAALGLE